MKIFEKFQQKVVVSVPLSWENIHEEKVKYFFIYYFGSDIGWGMVHQRCYGLKFTLGQRVYDSRRPA